MVWFWRFSVLLWIYLVVLSLVAAGRFSDVWCFWVGLFGWWGVGLLILGGLIVLVVQFEFRFPCFGCWFMILWYYFRRLWLVCVWRILARWCVWMVCLVGGFLAFGWLLWFVLVFSVWVYATGLNGFGVLGFPFLGCVFVGLLYLVIWLRFWVFEVAVFRFWWFVVLKVWLFADFGVSGWV